MTRPKQAYEAREAESEDSSMAEASIHQIASGDFQAPDWLYHLFRRAMSDKLLMAPDELATDKEVLLNTQPRSCEGSGSGGGDTRRRRAVAGRHRLQVWGSFGKPDLRQKTATGHQEVPGGSMWGSSVRRGPGELRLRCRFRFHLVRSCICDEFLWVWPLQIVGVTI